MAFIAKRKIAILKLLSDGRRRSAKEVAAALGIRENTATQQLSRYFEQGLLSRELGAKRPKAIKAPYNYTITEQGIQRIKYLLKKTRA